MTQENIDRKSWKPRKLSGRLSFQGHPGAQIVDQYPALLHELFLLRNPKHRFDKDYKDGLEKFVSKTPQGNWFYFPWSNTLVHFLPEAMHQELRTGRNRNLITSEEQQKFYNATIGVLGMSVGSHAALTIAMTGGAKHIKIADPDTLSGDNLNRIRTGFQNVGVKKVIAVARQIYEMNPYTHVEIFDEGLTEKNMRGFLKGLDVLVEEMDNPYLKIKIRSEAQKLKIPVVMAADNGDGIIVDVERYDMEKDYPILHGILGKMAAEDFKNVPSKDLPRVIARIAGADIAALQMLESVLEVGKSIYSWPQLGTAATLCGATLAYLARRIVLQDKKIKSGRYEVNPDAIFESGFHDAAEKKARDRKREEFLKIIGLE